MAGSDGVPRPPSCSGTIRFMAGSHQTLQAIHHACLSGRRREGRWNAMALHFLPDNVPPTLHDAPAGTVMIGNRLIQLEKTELSSLSASC